MLKINFLNVEEIVFSNPKLCRELPEFKHLFDQWRLAKMTPGLKTLGQRSMLEFLSEVKPEHISIIEREIGFDISIENNLQGTFNRCHDFKLEDAEHGLNSTSPMGNMVAYRDGERLYICFWK